MKASAIPIDWHNGNAPIYSAHFQPSHSITTHYRLATAGGDNNIRIWQLNLPVFSPDTSNADSSTNNNDNASIVNVTYMATLAKHTQPVIVVRFDPRGSILASAGDDGTIIFWSLFETSSFAFGEDASGDKETWKPRHICRHSLSEIYDLAWSPDSQYILAGSMDNIARIYSVATGQCIRELAEHSHYVQGVAWDPYNEYLATQSSDRSVHIYNLKGKDGSLVLGNPHKINRADLPAPPTPASETESSAPATPTSSSGLGAMNPPPLPRSHSRKSSVSSSPRPGHHPHSSASKSSSRASSPSPSFIPLPAVRQIGSPGPLGSSFGPQLLRSSYPYQNPKLPSFFRRLTFSPDGSLLLTPFGVYKYPAGNILSVHNLYPQDTNPFASQEDAANAVYIYTRSGLNRPPVAYLPGLKKPSLVVCCSPVFYKLRETQYPTETVTLGNEKPTEDNINNSNHQSSSVPSSSPVFSMPYRVVYAVITQDTAVIYDTEQHQPIAVVSNLSDSSFTDATWTPDGQMLFITSTDGVCSVALFDKDQLGEKYEGKVGPPSTISLSSSLGSSAISSTNNDGFAVPPPTQHSVSALISPSKRHISSDSATRFPSSVLHSPSPASSTLSISSAVLTNSGNFASMSSGYTSVPSTPGVVSFSASLPGPFPSSGISSRASSPGASSIGLSASQSDSLVPIASSILPIVSHGGSKSTSSSATPSALSDTNVPHSASSPRPNSNSSLNTSHSINNISSLASSTSNKRLASAAVFSSPSVVLNSPEKHLHETEPASAPFKKKKRVSSVLGDKPE